MVDKKQCREIVHALQAEALKNIPINVRMCSTPAQLKSLAKRMTQQAIANGVLDVDNDATGFKQ